MKLSVVENDFDAIYYELIIEESRSLRISIDSEGTFSVDPGSSLSSVDIERRTELLENVNSYLSRFFGDVEEFFQVESIYDSEGAQKAYSYLTFAIEVYESELEKNKKNFNIVGF
jgi:hypothetical protein